MGWRKLEKSSCPQLQNWKRSTFYLKVWGIQSSSSLGVQNTRIQPVLLRVFPSGVAVYKSPFKDVTGSQIIFAGPSKFFTQANKDQQRDSSHAVYSVSRDELNKSTENNIIGKFKSEPISKVKISHQILLLLVPPSWPG